MLAQSKLETADDVIEAAGGTSKVAARFNVSIEVVCMWRRNGFPARRYLQWQELLNEKNLSAPASLWGQK